MRVYFICVSHGCGHVETAHDAHEIGKSTILRTVAQGGHACMHLQGAELG